MTQSHPILRDFICPGCGKGTGRVGRECFDCIGKATQTCREGGCGCGECCEA